jgi:hypothetical protein
MKQRVLFAAIVISVVIGFGIATMVSPVQAKVKPACSVSPCNPDTWLQEICCMEWVPDNPRCRSPQKCPGEMVEVCEWVDCVPF